MTELTWNTQADWDAAQDRARVVTNGLGDRGADEIWLGWDPNHPPMNKAVSYWSLDESSGDVVDHIGSNNGSVFGNPTRDVTGLMGSTCYEFDGTDDYIDFGTKFTTATQNATFTNAAWVQVYNHKNYNGIAGNSHSSPLIIRMLVDSAGDVWFTHYANGTAYEVQTGNLNTNQWYFLAHTGDGSTQRCYIDATEVGTTSLDNTSTDEPTDTWKMGVRPDKTEERFMDGKIGEHFFADQALTASEIQDLYDATKDGYLTTAAKTA